jgi:chromosome segregation ATPase
MSGEEPTYEALKELYIKETRKTRHQKQELEKCVRNQQALQAAISERDAMIEERASSITKLVQLKDALTAEVESLRSQLASAAPIDTTAESVGELASAFNAERRALLKQIEDLTEFQTTQTSELDSVRSELADLRGAKATLEAELTTLRAGATVVDLSADETRARLVTALSQLETIRTQAIEFERKGGELSTQLAAISHENESLQKQLTETRDSLTAEKQELMSEVYVSKSDLEDQKRKYGELSNAHRAALAKLRENEDSLKQTADLRRQIEDLHRQAALQNQKFTAELDSVNRSENSRSKLIADLRAEVERVRTALDDQETELRTLRARNEELSAVSGVSKQELERLRKGTDDLRNQVKKATNAAQELEEQNHADRELSEKRESQLKALISALEANKVVLEQQLRSMQTQSEHLRAEMQQREYRARGFEEEAKAAEIERNQLQKEVAHLREALAKLEAARAEDEMQIAKIGKDRRKWELAKHQTDKKLQGLEAERKGMMDRIAALEKDRTPVGQATAVFPEYIRKVLLQFFIQDGSTREALIPVILNIVECDQKQVNQAMRCWAESNQIITHAFSFFGKS